MTALTRLGGMLAALAAFSAHAQSPESLDLAGRLFERSGLAVQLQSFPEQFEQGALQNRGKIPDEVIEALLQCDRVSR